MINKLEVPFTSSGRRVHRRHLTDGWAFRPRAGALAARGPAMRGLGLLPASTRSGALSVALGVLATEPLGGWRGAARTDAARGAMALIGFTRSGACQVAMTQISAARPVDGAVLYAAPRAVTGQKSALAPALPAFTQAARPNAHHNTAPRRGPSCRPLPA
jgi:hypothetical protein